MSEDSLAIDGFQNLPISELERVRAALNESGCKTRIRYRGPRAKAVQDNRGNSTRKKSECLKHNATHFSVYLR